MKKSKIVSYSSEELRQMSDESDWAAADAMTDEEIEAAIASDPEEAALHEGWLERIKARRHKARFVMCINSKVSDNLILHKVYKDIATKQEQQDNWVRVVDESGKYDLYAAANFVLVQIPVEAESGFEVVTA
jgi:hypothetical protein